MVASEARIAANRINALSSTGPKTPEGKERSRANALKHGLCATAVVPEDLPSINRRSNDLTRALKPQNEYHAWLVGEIAVITLRVNRCGRMERRLRDRHSLRAEVDWDEDRRHQAEALGAGIGRRPGPVVQSLRRTPHGCDWLMARWAILAQAADARGSWTEAQSVLAFDLLGTPLEGREGRRPGQEIDLDGRLGAEPDPATLARSRIADLLERREVVAGLDQADRALVEADLLDDGNAELKRLRRYESALHTRLRWCLAELRYQSPFKGPHIDGWPRWVARPEDTLKGEPEPDVAPKKPSELAAEARFEHPPIDLEPEECPPIGVMPDIPAILKSRVQKKLDRAEARRQAHRRKLDRLLA